MARPSAPLVERIDRLTKREGDHVQRCVVVDHTSIVSATRPRQARPDPPPDYQIRRDHVVCDDPRCIEPLHYKVIRERKFKYNDLPSTPWLDPRNPSAFSTMKRTRSRGAPDAPRKEIEEDDLDALKPHIKAEVLKRAPPSPPKAKPTNSNNNSNPLTAGERRVRSCPTTLPHRRDEALQDPQDGLPARFHRLAKDVPPGGVSSGGAVHADPFPSSLDRRGPLGHRRHQFIPHQPGGAFYFSCSGHGGFVIDARALTHEEYLKFRLHKDPSRPGLRQGRHARIPAPLVQGHPTQLANMQDFEFFVLEEDCDWCIAPLMAGIRTLDGYMTDEAAQNTFDAGSRRTPQHEPPPIPPDGRRSKSVTRSPPSARESHCHRLGKDGRNRVYVKWADDGIGSEYFVSVFDLTWDKPNVPAS
ncbi:hypothetical protein NKK48_30370 [Mesorhizobium sp. C386A]|uniref:hypothetical protein n=1 Tax=Mesorhizobium sp. C386A TaxID=2956831 RepID=UPI00333C4B4C